MARRRGRRGRPRAAPPPACGRAGAGLDGGRPQAVPPSTRRPVPCPRGTARYVGRGRTGPPRLGRAADAGRPRGRLPAAALAHRRGRRLRAGLALGWPTACPTGWPAPPLTPPGRAARRDEPPRPQGALRGVVRVVGRRAGRRGGRSPPRRPGRGRRAWWSTSTWTCWHRRLAAVDYPQPGACVVAAPPDDRGRAGGAGCAGWTVAIYNPTSTRTAAGRPDRDSGRAQACEHRTPRA